MTVGGSTYYEGGAWKIVFDDDTMSLGSDTVIKIAVPAGSESTETGAEGGTDCGYTASLDGSSVTVTFTSDWPEDCTVAAASYDSSGNLIDFETTGAADAVTIALDTDGAATVKVFILESLTTMAPVMPTTEIQVM